MSLQDDLTAIRATQKEFMPDSFDLLKPTHTPDGRGGQVTAYPAVKQGVKGRISTVGNNYTERVFVARVAPTTTHVVTLPYGTEIDATYKIRHVQTGAIYNITVDGSRGSLETAKRMYVVRDTV